MVVYSPLAKIGVFADDRCTFMNVVVKNGHYISYDAKCCPYEPKGPGPLTINAAPERLCYECHVDIQTGQTCSPIRGDGVTAPPPAPVPPSNEQPLTTSPPHWGHNHQLHQNNQHVLMGQHQILTVIVLRPRLFNKYHRPKT